MKSLRFFLLLIVSIGSDLIPKGIILILANLKSNNPAHKWAEYLPYIPVSSIFFGFLFGLVILLTASKNSATKITKEEVLGFAFICPLIKIISSYGSGFIAVILSKVGIDPSLAITFLFIFFTALVANEGLFLYLSNFLVFGIAFVGATLLYVVSLNLIKMPFYLGDFWYSYIGCSLATLFLLFEVEYLDEETIRERYALRRMAKRYK